MYKTKGSNQYHSQYRFKYAMHLFFILFLTSIALLAWGDNQAHAIVYPCPNECDPVKPATLPSTDNLEALPTVTPTAIPTPTPVKVPQIVAYIAHKFEPEGTAVVVKAINCFYSESGLRLEAYNYNHNGTEDRGIAQINSIWHLTPAQAHSLQGNIDKAYEIYKRSNSFNPWYGKGCR